MMNGYELHRQWFDWSFENPELTTPAHTALYCWLVELNNRMGWCPHFSAPASYCQGAIGIKSYTTFRKVFKDLVAWGFVKIIQESKNQYTANVVALPIFDKALVKALDKALAGHVSKQVIGTCESTCDINKPLNQETNKPINKETINISFDDFWNLYDYKKGRKKTEPLWEKLSNDDRRAIIEYLPAYKLATPDKTFRQHPATFINKETWQDEITPLKPQKGQISIDVENMNYTDTLQAKKNGNN